MRRRSGSALDWRVPAKTGEPLRISGAAGRAGQRSPARTSAIAGKHIAQAIGVALYQIARVRLKGNPVPVGGDGHATLAVVPVRSAAVGRGADQCGRCRHPVTNEHIGHPIGAFVARLSAHEPKATKRPFAEIAGWKLKPSASTTPVAKLTRVVVPPTRSRTKTSVSKLLSPTTSCLASSECHVTAVAGDGQSLKPACPITLGAPSCNTHARGLAPGEIANEDIVQSVRVAWSAARFLASEAKATKRPFAEIAGRILAASPATPARTEAGPVPCGTIQAVVHEHICRSRSRRR